VGSNRPPALKFLNMKYLFIFSTVLVFFNSCTKEECQFAGAYLFEVPAELTPAQDTFQIGDTIHFVSTFSDEVYERKTDRFYKLENFRFYPELILREISESIADEAGLLNFKVLVDNKVNFTQFNYSSGSVSYIGEYNYEDGTYTLRYSIIPESPGFFHFAHSSVLFGLGDDQDFAGKCKKKHSETTVFLNEGADNNIHMLSDSPDPHYNEWMLAKPEDRFHQFGGYVFYVVE